MIEDVFYMSIIKIIDKNQNILYIYEIEFIKEK
jgi:hypothetical protein